MMKMNFDNWISSKLNEADYPADEAMWNNIEMNLKPMSASQPGFNVALVSGIAATAVLVTLFSMLPPSSADQSLHVGNPANYEMVSSPADRNFSKVLNEGTSVTHMHQPQLNHEIELAVVEDASPKAVESPTSIPSGTASSPVDNQTASNIQESANSKSVAPGIKASGIQCPNSSIYFEAIGAPSSSYHWVIDGLNVIDGQSMSYEFSKSGTHEVVLVTNINGQSISTKRIIEIYEAPEAEVAISIDNNVSCFRQEVVLVAEPKEVTYTWLLNDIKVDGPRTKFFLEEGMHNISLTSVNEQGCSQTQTVTADVREGKQLFIPSGFSPDNDGQNDEWTVTGLEDCASHLLQVYRITDNTLVFETTENKPWSGTIGNSIEMPRKGEKFLYRLSATDECGFSKEFSGTVTAIGR